MAEIVNGVPIPGRKPPGSGGADGFLDSLVEAAKRVSNDAFETSYNVLRIKQLFENEDQVFANEPIAPSSDNPSVLRWDNAAVTGTGIDSGMIGLILGGIGLLLLFGD